MANQKFDEFLCPQTDSSNKMQRRLSIPSIPGESSSLQWTISESSLPRGIPTSSIVVGILGASTAYTELHINQLTETITQLWGKPAQLIFQQSGTAMMFIDAWAEDNNIPTIPIQAEWAKYGPKACMYVNNKIEKEATHIVIIRSPRAKSDKMLQKAEQLSSKRNKPCLVLMNIEPDGSAVIDSYESPIKILEKKKLTGTRDIRNMFLTTTSPKID